MITGTAGWIIVWILSALAPLPQTGDSRWRTWCGSDFPVCLEIPRDWRDEIILSNSGAEPAVISEKACFDGPGGPMICLDVWRNGAGLDLVRWFDRYHRPLLAPEARVPAVPNTTVDGAPAFRLINHQQQSCDQVITVFVKDGLAMRLEYRNSDAERSLAVYDHMLETLVVGR